MVNGILFPGGGNDIFIDEEKEIGFSEMTKSAKYLIELAM